MSKPVLSDCLVRLYLQLEQFEIIYVPHKAVKGQVLADFLANHPLPAKWELCDELPNEDVMNVEMMPPWKMYFDSAAHQGGAEAGVIFLSPHQDLMLGDYKVKKPELIPYHGYAKRLLQSIDLVSIKNVPKKMNKQVDALPGLVSSLTYPGGRNQSSGM
ncbi:hypothetical protein LIER_19973 [Lithospermum erythrorhizon]|uniref:Uncharacterized protein n=1 Tax=Lithospermum erythrorhizon TaxID=34254 RepID=A0AAV3QMB1_LITER